MDPNRGGDEAESRDALEADAKDDNTQAGMSDADILKDWASTTVANCDHMEQGMYVCVGDRAVKVAI
eukprot:11467642-Prorocentrum_lima.AAC.1